jgi:iron complex outermembrane recepter protein
LYYNVGRAILLGNVDGRFEEGGESLITLASFNEYRNSPSLLEWLSKLERFHVDRIRPERVRTIEAGYRGTLWEKVYLDMSAYYSVYRDFIGFVLGIDADFDSQNGFPSGPVQAYRVSANADGKVTTQGLTIGANYFYKRTTFSGNYSWNKLISGDDDPIIPAFNTPEHKFNFGISARDMTIFNRIKNFGYSLNYKWIQGFIFEGSPQFTGPISTYDMMDARVNWHFPKAHCTVSAGGSNIIGLRPFFRTDLASFGEKMERAWNNENLQVYGGPLVGRLLYVSVLFELVKKP